MGDDTEDVPRERGSTSPHPEGGSADDPPHGFVEPLVRSLSQALEHAEDPETRYHLRNALQLAEILRRR